MTDTDLEVIRRIRQRMYPSLGTDTTEMVEFDNPAAKIHPEGKTHPPKSRFLPSKWERMKVRVLHVKGSSCSLKMPLIQRSLKSIPSSEKCNIENLESTSIYTRFNCVPFLLEIRRAGEAAGVFAAAGQDQALDGTEGIGKGLCWRKQ